MGTLHDMVDWWTRDTNYGRTGKKDPFDIFSGIDTSKGVTHNVVRLLEPTITLSTTETPQKQVTLKNEEVQVIGNSRVMEMLHDYIKAGSVPHLLLCGPPGHGKTTIGRYVSSKLDTNYQEVNGNAVKTIADLFALINRYLTESGVLLIDEIHAISPKVQELLYEALTSLKIQKLGKSLQGMTLKPFTLIGTTTEASTLLEPFRQRFHAITIDPYSIGDLLTIIKPIVPNERLARVIIAYSKDTPRIALQLAKHVRLLGDITEEGVKKVIRQHNLYPFGLEEPEIRLLQALKNGPLSVQVLAGRLVTKTKEIETILEPYLLKLGFISRSSKGRELTNMGFKYLQELGL